MSTFEQSRWADRAFAQEYLDHADHYIPDRFHLFALLRSFYRAFVKQTAPRRICDVGCGDGILTDQLLREDPSIEPTLVDGSADMLAAARKRFQERPQLRFVQRGFTDLIRDSAELGAFHFIVSAFAIHHLERSERQPLFATLRRHLEPGGWFLNIEAVTPDHPVFTEWYYQFWQEWIIRRGQMLGLGDKYHDIPRQARTNPDNKYSPVSEQLADLAAAGLIDVECHYKNGIFAVYAGRNPATK